MDDIISIPRSIGGGEELNPLLLVPMELPDSSPLHSTQSSAFPIPLIRGSPWKVAIPCLSCVKNSGTTARNKKRMNDVGTTEGATMKVDKDDENVGSEIGLGCYPLLTLVSRILRSQNSGYAYGSTIIAKSSTTNSW